MSHTPLRDYFANLPEPIASLQMIDICVGIALTFSMFSVITAIFNALVATKYSPRIVVLKGLTPLAMTMMTFVALFGFTEWAWTHPGYVIIMTCPLVSLINSR